MKEVNFNKADIEIYKEAFLKYRPEYIKYLFVCESPPAYKNKDDMSYFYFENNRSSEILFSTIIKAIYDIDYKKKTHNKAELLENFKRDGFFLMDAVFYPINKDLEGKRTSEKIRKQEIYNNMPDFIGELKKMVDEKLIDKNTKLILIKKTVYDCLYEELLKRGFNVANTKAINFPAYYKDRCVLDDLRDIIDNQFKS